MRSFPAASGQLIEDFFLNHRVNFEFSERFADDLFLSCLGFSFFKLIEKFLHLVGVAHQDGNRMILRQEQAFEHLILSLFVAARHGGGFAVNTSCCLVSVAKRCIIVTEDARAPTGNVDPFHHR
jgi:hypothetical protein